MENVTPVEAESLSADELRHRYPPQWSIHLFLFSELGIWGARSRSADWALPHSTRIAWRLWSQLPNNGRDSVSRSAPLVAAKSQCLRTPEKGWPGSNCMSERRV